jgi:UDP-N-acetylglucosamine 2-epimerase (non-hydrolysing)
MKKILCIVGTRPEAIKMGPVIQAFRACSWATAVVLSTGQHNEILHQTLSDFDVSVDIDLELMQENQSLGMLTSRVFGALEPLLREMNPDFVLAQGDTTTVMVAALQCFYQGIAFGHVEAGLRTFNIHHPFPEELNRAVTARVATLHFAPTLQSRENLLAEGIPETAIFVTGNTVIDALLKIASEVQTSKISLAQRVVLVTTHRRENFGEPIQDICAALRNLHNLFPDVSFVYPVHPNPNIRDVVYRELQGLERVALVPPLSYREIVSLLKRAYLVLTDSGGLQEEAPALGKPVLVLRNTTERPEAVAAGVVKIIGTEKQRIIEETRRLLTDRAYYASIAKGTSLYGDGHASDRIVEIVRVHLGVPAEAKP